MAAESPDRIEGFTARPAAIGQGAKMYGTPKMSSMGTKSNAKNTIGAAAKPKAPKIGMAAKVGGIKSVTSQKGMAAR